MFFICGLKNTIKNIKQEQEIILKKMNDLSDKIEILENILILQNKKINDMEHSNPIENIIDTVDTTLSSPSIYIKFTKLVAKLLFY